MGPFCRDFPDRNTEEISTRDLDEWMVGWNVGPVTRNTYRRDLNTLFSFCVTRGYSAKNPAEGTRAAKEIAKPVGILTVDEAARLLSAVPSSLIPYVAIGAFAGLRAAEVERLDWSNVDLEGGFIEITAKNAKTARRRLVKVLPNLHAWLTDTKARGLSSSGKPAMAVGRWARARGADSMASERSAPLLRQLPSCPL